ncbi:MAG: hypothetical protein LBC41_17675 [Clostridiales bacterium]|jgi:hypothetical protein|nr:hypothetical protein [Clostridiales bacterium]
MKIAKTLFASAVLVAALTGCVAETQEFAPEVFTDAPETALDAPETLEASPTDASASEPEAAPGEDATTELPEAAEPGADAALPETDPEATTPITAPESDAPAVAPEESSAAPETVPDANVDEPLTAPQADAPITAPEASAEPDSSPADPAARLEEFLESEFLVSDTELGVIIGGQVVRLSIIVNAMAEFAIRNDGILTTPESVRTDSEYIEFSKRASDLIADLDAFDFSPYERTSFAEACETLMGSIVDEFSSFVDSYPELLANGKFDEIIANMNGILEYVTQIDAESKKLFS